MKYFALFALFALLAACVVASPVPLLEVINTPFNGSHYDHPPIFNGSDVLNGTDIIRIPLGFNGTSILNGSHPTNSSNPLYRRPSTGYGPVTSGPPFLNQSHFFNRIKARAPPPPLRLSSIN